jgi:hypothetical protein
MLVFGVPCIKKSPQDGGGSASRGGKRKKFTHSRETLLVPQVIHDPWAIVTIDGDKF